MTKSERAISKFKGGYNCAQSVFFAFLEDLEIGQDTALKVASGFGGGIGRRGEVCGAVTGGIMALGAKHGRGEKEDPTAADVTYAKTREFMAQFARKHGSCLCRELLNGCDLATEEGQAAFREKDLKNKVCIPCVQSAVEMVEKMM
ncbi:MAG: C_GCAxxG_C_C family protein [Anaerolineales bacterium]|nr:C_GCAxxG_C_C family protein [Anaerolineales bacterium]